MKKKEQRKILCLGVSYPDIEAQMKANDVEPSELDAACNSITVETVIECVQRDILTQMDGRDLCRCLASERLTGSEVYTVSQEKGAIYRTDRHFEANFNRASFVRVLRKHFETVEFFDQIILDYFWIPPGWDLHHWSCSFFGRTLPAFSAEGLLRPGGAIYLPFCFHCFKEVSACFDTLKRHYNVSFLRKHELGEITFWSGTQTLCPMDMQNVLGKRVDQEEVYCTFSARDIRQAMSDGRVSKEELMELAQSLEDFADIRFLVLRPLSAEEQTGRFIGLTDSAEVRRGVDFVPTSLPIRTAVCVGSTGSFLRRSPRLIALELAEQTTHRQKRTLTNIKQIVVRTNKARRRFRNRSPDSVAADSVNEEAESKSDFRRRLF
jgi:hypothetical protein